MKKFIILLISILLIIILISCSKDRHEQDKTYNEYYYNVESFKLDIGIDYEQLNIFLHKEQLHLIALEVDKDTLDSFIHLLTMNPDGSNMQEIYRSQIDKSIDFLYIIGFEKHDDGHITIVSRDGVIVLPHTREDVLDGLWDYEVSSTYVYRRLSPVGEILYVSEIDALNNDERQIIISDVVFDINGNVVASGTYFPDDFEFQPIQVTIPGGNTGQSFFMFNNGLSGDYNEVEDTRNFGGFFNLTNDGQVIASNFKWLNMTNHIMFYEIDFENVIIRDGPIIEMGSNIDSLSGVFPAPEASEYDFYLVCNDREFVGYRKSDESFTLLIDFLELGVSLDRGMLDKNNLLLWDDERITVVNMTWNGTTRREEVTLFLLTPSDESIKVEREVITIGGIEVNYLHLLREQVAVFNRYSNTHRIEIVNYTYDDLDRLRTQLIAGRGPDMIILSGLGSSLVPVLSEGNFMLDLYKMIDLDPDINREDFFPSILSTLENSRGELVQISPDFTIQTFIGKQFDFPETPENWNYSDFIDYYKEARVAGYNYPMGQTIDRLQILDLLLFTDDTFFCERSGMANFDSKEFIDVLNFVLTIPENQGWEMIPKEILEGGLWDPIGDLVRGEQLLLPFEPIFGLSDFRTLQTRLGGIKVTGFPSNDGPTHSMQFTSGRSVGIRSNSPHINAAWEFVKLGLLPDAPHFGNFPLRVDLFEQLINNEISRTNTQTKPDVVAWVGGSIDLPPLTEIDAELLYEIVININNKHIIGHPVQDIIKENTQAFFAGNRSAEDTARIIQSRVQVFLAERAR